MDLHQEAAKIFDDLFMVTCKQLGLMGIPVEPSDVVKRVISPVKEVYLKGLADLLALTAGKQSREVSAEETAKKLE